MKFSKAQLKKIVQNYQIADIYLFGSQISGFKHPGSDLDIGVRFKMGLPIPGKRGKIYGDLFSDLSLIFKKERIDLVFLEEAPLHFKFRIVAEGELIYSEDFKKSLDFKEKIINFYRDYKFFIDEYFKGILDAPTKI